MYKKFLTFLLAFMIVSAFMITPKEVEAFQRRGYVSKQYLKAYSKPDRSPLVRCVVNLNDPVNGYLNVRSSPSINGEVIGRLHHGNYITIDLSRSTADWAYVQEPLF